MNSKSSGDSGWIFVMAEETNCREGEGEGEGEGGGEVGGEREGEEERELEKRGKNRIACEAGASGLLLEQLINRQGSEDCA